jgi:hypothetical protein
MSTRTVLIPVWGRGKQYEDIVSTSSTKKRVDNWSRLVSAFNYYVFDQETAVLDLKVIILVRQQDLGDDWSEFPQELM